MRPLLPEEILDPALEAPEAPALPDLPLGAGLVLRFESRDAVRVQLRERLRAGGSPDLPLSALLEAGNAALGDPGDLPASLSLALGEAADPGLPEGRALLRALFAVMADGTEVPALFDPAAPGPAPGRPQSLRFPVGGEAPVAVSLALPGHRHTTGLEPSLRRLLAEQLAADPG